MAAERASGAEAGAQLIRVRDEAEVLEFPGTLVAEASTWSAGKTRWVEIILHAIADGSGRYVLSRTGKSLVYHRIGGTCNKGVRRPVTELASGAEPCPFCRPPERDVLMASPGAEVAAEVDHHGASLCSTAQDVIKKLRIPGLDDDDGLIGGSYSAPAQRLLDEARQRDSAFEKAMSGVRRL